MATAEIWMTEVGITARYGWRNLPGVGRNFHEGVDTATGGRYEVSAWMEGVVTESPQVNRHPIYGWYIRYGIPGQIEVSHHSLDGPARLKVGQRVATGNIVGNAGISAAGTTGVHCHNGLWLGGNHVDPLKYLTPGKTTTVTYGEAPSGGGATPIVEDDMYEQSDRNRDNNIYAALYKGASVMIDGKVQKFNYGILPIVVHNQTLIARQSGQIAALSTAVKQLQGGGSLDLSVVEAAAERGAREAFDGLKFTAEVD